jgi:hypothetical protein
MQKRLIALLTAVWLLLGALAACAEGIQQPGIAQADLEIMALEEVALEDEAAEVEAPPAVSTEPGAFPPLNSQGFLDSDDEFVYESVEGVRLSKRYYKDRFVYIFTRKSRRGPKPRREDYLIYPITPEEEEALDEIEAVESAPIDTAFEESVDEAPEASTDEADAIAKEEALQDDLAEDAQEELDDEQDEASEQEDDEKTDDASVTADAE